MFHSARIKLTAWYLLIIMTISLSFSGVIYVGMCRELERGFRRVDLRHRAEELGIPLPRFFPPAEDLPSRLQEMVPRYFYKEDLEEARKRLILNLGMTNGIILVVSSLAGYFLAGRTLSPIENALEEQKRFVTDASHELRTPLTSLKSEIEVSLRDKKLTLAEAKKLLLSNLEEVNNLHILSDSLIKLTQYQKGSNGLVFSQVSLSLITKEAIKKVFSLAKNKNITIENQINNFVIEGNQQSLIELMVIFLDNAIKYSPEKTRIKLTSKKTDGYISVNIADQGFGIKKEDIHNLFNRFYRVDKSRTKFDVPGYGLGLSIAKQIVEKHGGTIKVQSKLNTGSTFTVKLPIS